MVTELIGFVGASRLREKLMESLSTSSEPMDVSMFAKSAREVQHACKRTMEELVEKGLARPEENGYVITDLGIKVIATMKGTRST